LHIKGVHLNRCGVAGVLAANEIAQLLAVLTGIRENASRLKRLSRIAIH